MACQYFYKAPGEKEGKWYTEEELKILFAGIPPSIKWWEEPEFKKRNPNFDYQAYLNDVNKFGENNKNLPEHLKTEEKEYEKNTEKNPNSFLQELDEKIKTYITEKYSPRVVEIYTWRETGLTFKEVAAKMKELGYSQYNSEERVRQIYNKVKIDVDSKNLQQKQGIQQSKASPKTIEKIKEFLTRNKIDLQHLDTKKYGNINGIAHILEKMIEIADGKEDVAITEEMMHFVVDSLKQSEPALYKEMLNKISKYDIYSQTKELYFEDKNYQNEDGSPNILKIKDEAIAKLLAEFYIKKNEGITEKPELLIQTKTWWEKLISWIKGLLRIAEFNPFEKGAEVVDDVTISNKLREYAELIEANMNPDSFFYSTVKNLNEDGKYKDVVMDIVDQLRTAYAPTVEQVFGGNETLAKEILENASPFLQKAPENNKFAQEIMKKLENKIKEFGVEKHVEEAQSEDEDGKNYYTAIINGKEEQVGRTTEWAKAKNKEFTKGRDFFANLSKEDKKIYDILAQYGVKGHYDIERIIKSALNDDGTLKPREEVKIDIKPASPIGVFKILQNYLLGDDNKIGWLYQFEPGSVFLTEQIVFNEHAISTENNKKVNGRAGTIDLLILTPSEKVLIYDWKFMRVNEQNPRYNPLKINQHKLQLADYKRTLKEGYGVKPSDVNAFTVPIAAVYDNVTNDKTKEKLPVLRSIGVGKINLREEDRPHLLSVAPDDQSTGNKEIDKLLSSLRAKYQRIYKKKGGGEEKYRELNELADAIRQLQVAINFEPLSVEARNFEKGLSEIIKKYKGYNPLSASEQELKLVFSEITQAINTAEYYSNIDSVFTSEYDRNSLSEGNKKVLDSLQKSSSVAKNGAIELREELKNIISQIANSKGIANILSAEKEVKGILNDFIQSGNLPLKALKFLTKVTVEARSADELEVKQLLDQFDPIYQEFIKLANSRGVKNPLSLIADLKEHKLFYQVDRTGVYGALKNKDRKALLKYIDSDKYKMLMRERLKQEYEKINNKTYSQDERTNAYKKELNRNLIDRDLNMYQEDFTGWNNRTFRKFIMDSIKEEENYTKEYLAIKGNKAALDMYNFLIALNERAKDSGYLDERHGKSFIAFVNATMAQRLIKSTNKWKALKGSVEDMFTVQEYEEQRYGKKDSETGEIDRSIPQLFTTELDEEKRSTDLFGIIPIYIKALVQFETSQKLEDLFQAVVMLEENKGHLEEHGGKVVFENDLPKEFEGNSANANILKDYMDDQIYGVRSQYEDLIARGISKISSKDNAERKVLSAKKTVQTLNRWTQQLAVGLKFLIALPNHLGAHAQAVINSGKFYTWQEYEKNKHKLLASKFGGVNDIEKGLLDMFVSLNNENFNRKVKDIAWKQSTRKYLESVSFHDFMMSFNRIADLSHQSANALSWIQNTMLDEEGNLVNIRKYLSKQPEYKARYDHPETLKEKEKELDKKVKEYKETKSLPKIAKWEGDYLIIPGMNKASLASYRAKIVEYGRNITSQSSNENKSRYKNNIIFSSFMMFKNWIVPQLELRGLDIHKNVILDEWEYGRVRLLVKTISHLGIKKIGRIRDIIKATPKGIEIMREMLEQKIEDYYKKTGQKLDITEAEFFDMVRKELQSEMKELELLLGVIGLVWAIGAAQPPKDADPDDKNLYKFMARLSKKAADELRFYYSPLSAQSILQGSIFPSLGILSKASKVLEHTYKLVIGDDRAKPLKYLINLVPGPSQFQNELLPIINPEMAKDLGIKTTAEARVFR